jgi:hypothetical protein
MTFLQLYGEGLNIELGSDDNTQLFTTVRRKAAINAGQLEFIKRTKCFRKVATIALTHNTREYDLNSTLVTGKDFLSVWDDGVEYVLTSGGTASYRSGPDFPRRDLSWLNQNQQGWRVASASQYPQFWYLRDPAGSAVTLGLSEPPSITGTNTASITLPYVARCPDMSADGASPFNSDADAEAIRVVEPYHQALAHFGASVLERLRKNYDGVQAQLALFAGYVADYLQEQNPRDGERMFMAHDYRAAAGRMPLSRAQRDPLIY